MMHVTPTLDKFQYYFNGTVSTYIRRQIDPPCPNLDTIYFNSKNIN